MLLEPSSGSKTSRYLPRWYSVGMLPRLLHLLGGQSRQDAGPLSGPDEDVVRDDVKRLLTLALDVDDAHIIADAGERAVRYRAADELARLRDGEDELVELAGRVGMLAPRLDEVLRQRGPVLRQCPHHGVHPSLGGLVLVVGLEQAARPDLGLVNRLQVVGGQLRYRALRTAGAPGAIGFDRARFARCERSRSAGARGEPRGTRETPPRQPGSKR